MLHFAWVYKFVREGSTAESLVLSSRTAALKGIGAVLVSLSLLCWSSTAQHVYNRHAPGRFVERHLVATCHGSCCLFARLLHRQLLSCGLLSCGVGCGALSGLSDTRVAIFSTCDPCRSEGIVLVYVSPHLGCARSALQEGAWSAEIGRLPV